MVYAKNGSCSTQNDFNQSLLLQDALLQLSREIGKKMYIKEQNRGLHFSPDAQTVSPPPTKRLPSHLHAVLFSPSNTTCWVQGPHHPNCSTIPHSTSSKGSSWPAPAHGMPLCKHSGLLPTSGDPWNSAQFVHGLF